MRPAPRNAVRIDSEGQITLKPLVDFRAPGATNPYAELDAGRGVLRIAKTLYRPVRRAIPIFLMETGEA